MEVDVRRVGLHSCFVALPPALLEVLLSGNEFPSFPVVLELKPVSRSGLPFAPCFVAWNGAATNSRHVEIAEALADCLGIMDGARVRVRARIDVSQADSVVVEPATEDDWEILELNAQYLEDHILSKVGILHSGQQFPVWVTGKVGLKLRVISTDPQGIVKLVPGAEIIVAPKKRGMGPAADVTDGEFCNEETLLPPRAAVWLRVQELDSSLAQALSVGGMKCSTTPSTCIYISAETAKLSSLSDGQVVLLRSGVDEADMPKSRSRSIPTARGGSRRGNDQVRENETSEDEDVPHRQAVVRIVIRGDVAVGHAMVGFALRLFIGVTIHMTIKLQGISNQKAPWPEVLEVSPVLFQAIEREEGTEMGVDNVITRGVTARLSHEHDQEHSLHTRPGRRSRWSGHRDLLSEGHGRSEVKVQNNDMCATSLLRSWLEGQLLLAGGLSKEGVPIFNETLIHIRVGTCPRPRTSEEFRRLQRDCVSDVLRGSSSGKGVRNYLFLLSLRGGKDEDINRRGRQHKTRLDEGKGLFFSLTSDGLEKSTSYSEPQGKSGSESVHVGHPCYLPCSPGHEAEHPDGPDLSSLSWLEALGSEALARLKIQLSLPLRKKIQLLGTPLPGFVLLHGPPACGKTQLAMALSRAVEEDKEVLAHRVVVSCAELVGEQAMLIRGILKDAIQEAVHHAPSLVILDDLDVLLAAGDVDGPGPGAAVLSISEYIGDFLDSCQGRQDSEFPTAAVSFLGVAKLPTALPKGLCVSGRLDYHIQLPSPAAKERATILTQMIKTRGLACLAAVATKAAAGCDGADATDMELLLDRAVHAAAGRFLSRKDHSKILSKQTACNPAVSLSEDEHEVALSALGKEKFEILDEDFSVALQGYVPVAMRGIGRSGRQLSHVGWEDVGGLGGAKGILREMLEMPVKYSHVFEKAPLRLRTGVLLYGPPGCGKTHIVGAAAAACSLRLLAVKGPELLNKYIGASEQGVRDIFAKAVAGAPCILFFDEFDAIAPKRGHDNTGVTDRVVNQLLTELDGVEALNGVFVFAATSRPDLIDAALLRPGRLDRRLFCDFPSFEERMSILDVLSRKLSMADDVDMHLVASLTDGFSGADLQAVLSDAQLDSVHTFLSKKNTGEVDGQKPVVTMGHLRETLRKARPSVPEVERRRLNVVYESFMGPKTSSKVMDVKGKRATLA